jgi:hypothetical protein
LDFGIITRGIFILGFITRGFIFLELLFTMEQRILNLENTFLLFTAKMGLLQTDLEDRDERIVKLESRLRELEEGTGRPGRDESAQSVIDNADTRISETHSDDGSELSGSKQSQSGHSNMMGMFTDYLAAANVKLPFLKDLEKEHIRQFILNYEEYEINCPDSLVKKASRFVKREFLEMISNRSLHDARGLLRLSNDEFFVQLCGLHHVNTVMEAESRLKLVKMKSDDLSLSSLMRYNQDFEFELKTLGPIATNLAQKAKVKIYMNGLRPNNLVYALRLSDPRTVSEAMSGALAQLDTLRTLISQAKYYAPGPPKQVEDNKKPKKGPPNTPEQAANSMKELICFVCGEKGHVASKCPNKGKKQYPKANPAVKTVQFTDYIVHRCDGLCRIPLCLEGSGDLHVKGVALLDTGANLDCVNFDQVKCVADQIMPYERDVLVSLATSEAKLEAMGLIYLDVVMVNGHRYGRRPFHVIKSLSEDIIISLHTISELNWFIFFNLQNLSDTFSPSEPCVTMSKSSKVDGTSSLVKNLNELSLDMDSTSHDNISTTLHRLKTPNGSGDIEFFEFDKLDYTPIARSMTILESLDKFQVEMDSSDHESSMSSHLVASISNERGDILNFDFSKKTSLRNQGTVVVDRITQNPNSTVSSLSNLHVLHDYNDKDHDIESPDTAKICVNSSILYSVDENFSKLTELNNILSKYSILFGPLDKIGLKTAPMQIKLKPNYVLKSLPPRFMPRDYMDTIKSDIDQLVNMGILIPVDYAEVASPLVIVKKPDGGLRMAVDYRELNSQLAPFAGSIPDVHSLFPFLANKRYYAKLDNLWGYYQARVAESDQHLTTITTIWGLFRFTRCPFGISTAPGIYQHTMAHIILKDVLYKKCVVFIDDTIVYGSTEEEFLSNLDDVLGLMVRFNVRLKPQKCSFGFPSTMFLGILFDAHGYSLSDERKQGILDLPLPSSLSKLRSFLGMANFFRDFIANYSLIVSPLTHMTKAHSFVWTEKAMKAFSDIKVAIMETTSLRHLKGDGRITLYTDASMEGIGAYLTQVQENDIEYPIIFISKKFPETAQRWSTIEQECFAVYYSILRLESYLLGRHFVVATDHKNLLYLQNSTIPKLVRWRLRLLEFDFTLLHIPGKENVVADALSRINSLVGSTDLLITSSVAGGGDVVAIADAGDFDKLALLKSIHNGIVGHRGFHQMLYVLRQMEVTWPHMRQDILKFLKNCGICQKVKHNLSPAIAAASVHTISSSAPMLRVSADTIGPLPEDDGGNSFILVVIDEFSRFTELFPIPSTAALTYVHSLLRHVGFFGVPSEVRTDGGTQFTANVCTALMEFLGIQHVQILPYHPQANGIVERRNAEVLKHLRAIVLERRVKMQWSLHLPIIQNILNSTYCSSIKARPNDLIFGTNYAIDLGYLVRQPIPPTPVEEFIVDLQERIQVVMAQSSAYLEHQANLRKEKYQEIVADTLLISDLHVGDYVLVTYPTRPPHKLSPIYRGPFTVVEVLGDNIVRVSDFNSAKTFVFHVDRLRLFKCADTVMPDELAELSAADADEFTVEDILDHRRAPSAPPRKRGRTTLEFLVRWLGYDPSSDTWEPYMNVRDCAALDRYAELHPELNLL